MKCEKHCNFGKQRLIGWQDSAKYFSYVSYVWHVECSTANSDLQVQYKWRSKYIERIRQPISKESEVLTEKFAAGATISGTSSPLQVCTKADLVSRHKGQGISNNSSLFTTNWKTCVILYHCFLFRFPVEFSWFSLASTCEWERAVVEAVAKVIPIIVGTVP